MDDLSGIMRSFVPAGPVASAFMNDRNNQVMFLMGPIGGGKTTAAIFKMVAGAYMQPVCRDGWRRFRGMVVRDTYRNLYESTIPSWHMWFPKSLGGWSGSRDAPARHVIKTRTPDGLMLELDMSFRAMGESMDIEALMRGWEGTAIWIEEADLTPDGTLREMTSRLPRYPSKQMLPDGAEPYSFAIGTLNAPDDENWVYRTFEEDRPEGFRMYRQPSGLSPEAENLHNLNGGRKYYDSKIAGRPDWWIRRMIHCEYGYSRDGKPVFEEYHDKRHCAPEPFGFAEGVSVTLGLDQDLHPAAIFCQVMPDGQWRAVEEIVPGRMGPQRFGELLSTKIAQWGVTVRGAFADPAGFRGADKDGGELAWAEIVGRAIGKVVLPAPSNKLDFRLGAISSALSYTIDGERPGLIISPACRMLRRGFNSMYRFRKLQGSSGYQREAPDKSVGGFHDIQDALQYAITGQMGQQGIVHFEQTARRSLQTGRPHNTTHQLTSGFDVFSV